MNIEYLTADAGGIIVLIIIIGLTLVLVGSAFIPEKDQEENEFIPFNSEDDTSDTFLTTDEGDLDFMVEDLRKKGKGKRIADETIEKQLKIDFPKSYKPPKT